MGLLDKLNKGVVVYDGATGTYLQQEGLASGQCAEEWNLTNPDAVRRMTDAYIKAGSQVVQTNTFSANGPMLKTHGLEGKEEEINEKGAEIALKCVEGTDVEVAASVGPTGLYFAPAGYLNFDEAVQIFTVQLRALKRAGIKLVNFETFMDINEMRAAVMAAERLGGLEIISTMTFKGERTMNGTPADACAVTLTALGADVIGANCSGGPGSLQKPIEMMENVCATPLCVKPNAGVPEVVNGKTEYSLKPEAFAKDMVAFAQSGARLLGGCCGTTPEYISDLSKELAGKTFEEPKRTNGPIIASPLGILDLSRDDLAYCQMDLHTVRDAMIDDNFMSVSDVLPVDWESCDVCILDMHKLVLDFDVEKLVTAVTLFLKIPVILTGGSHDVVELFLKYYPGRAGIVHRQNMPEVLFGAVVVGSGYKPLNA